MKRVVLLGLLAFLLALAVVLPARWLAGFLPASVQCARITGSAWRGACQGLKLAGAQPIGIDTLRWRIQPLALLKLSLVADFTATSGQGDASGRVTIDARDHGRLSGVSGQALVDRQLPGLLPAGWRGRFEASGLEVEWRGRAIQHLGGQLRLRDATDAQGNLLGNYRLEFQPASAPPFNALLQDDGGAFEVNGIVTIAADRGWTLEGTVAPRGEGAQRYARQLEMLGPADASGRHRLSAAGSVD